MEEERRKFSIKHFLIIILVLVIALAIVISIRGFTFKKEYEPPTYLAADLPRYRSVDMDSLGITSDEDNDGINDQEDIMLGAKRQLIKPAKNIFTLEEEELNYYAGGDPPVELAISTDIIARAMLDAGYILKELVYEDISSNFDQYPLREIWGQTVCDPNIDHRRIQNLEIFLIRNADSLTTVFNPLSLEELNKWYPGDIILFDMDLDGFTDCAGILSDSTTREGITKVIYNYIDPGHTVEEDILNEKVITGHYRYPDRT